MRFWLLSGLWLMVVLGLWPVAPSPSLAQVPQVEIGRAVNGFIASPDASQDWEFVAREDGDLGIVVKRISGDLDVTVQVLDAGGKILAENDDWLDGFVLDAGIESLVVEKGETYSIRVGSYRGGGDYRLWLIPAAVTVWEAEDFEGNVSRWSSAYAIQQNGRLILDSLGQSSRSVLVMPKGQVALGDFYVQAEFEWVKRDAQALYGLMVRGTLDSSTQASGYYFVVDGNGQWRVMLQEAGVSSDLVAPTTAEVLEAEHLTLGVLAEGDTFHFYANGLLLGTVEDVRFGSGYWGLYMRNAGIPTSLAVDHVLVTVPELSEMPDYPQDLETWRSARPSDIAAELAEAGVIPEGGRRGLTILETGYQVGSRQTRVHLQTEAGQSYADMMVGVDVVLREGDNFGCGLGLRYVDDSNQVLAFADLDGGAGFLQVLDGEIRFNTYDLVEAVESPLANGAIRLIVVMRGEWMGMYVNDRLLATAFMPAVAGGMGVALVNYSTSGAACRFDNFWMWSW